MRQFWQRRTLWIAGLSLAAILTHLILRFGLRSAAPDAALPLKIALVLGGLPLVWDLGRKAVRGEFGSDLLAGMSIVTAAALGDYLAGSIVVLMLSGGESLEEFAIGKASSALQTLAKRMPSVAHRKAAGKAADIAVEDIAVGDEMIVYPHEICPVDGVVLNGHSTMDESFLTGEPFTIPKTTGAMVVSGAINGEDALTIRAVKRAVDSRYAKIVDVMRRAEQDRPRMRRLADQLGAWYTPVALGVAVAAWVVSGQSERFLAVLVVATPCPLIIAVPVAIIGAISLSARRGIVIRSPAALEQVSQCEVVMFDKTGTLTCGRPRLAEQQTVEGVEPREALMLAASLERYSKHPLASAILDAAEAQGITAPEADTISERPGRGLEGRVCGRNVRLVSLTESPGAKFPEFPDHAGGGLECGLMIDGAAAAAFRFRDEARGDGASFISHLMPKHHFRRAMIISGDRRSEVEYLAQEVGVTEIHAEASPEEKLEIVKRETSQAKTLFIGDGLNDAPAMKAATVGVAIGANSDVTAEAADVVVMEASLKKVDEFMHISRRMRSIALQSAIGGMALSVVGMGFAAGGMLVPVAGAIAQEVIDLAVVLNALRAALAPRQISDL